MIINNEMLGNFREATNKVYKVKRILIKKTAHTDKKYKWSQTYNQKVLLF